MNQATEAVGQRHGSATDADAAPRPFTLRVAVRRFPIDEAPESEGNQHLIFSRRAGLTGSLAQTRSGEDVEVSDVEIA